MAIIYDKRPVEPRPTVNPAPPNNSTAPPMPQQNPISQRNPMPKQSPSFLKQNKWSVVIISLSVLIIGIGMYFALRHPKTTGPTQPKVNLSIEAPAQVPSGSQIVYRIHVSNQDSAAIKNVLLDLLYPPGFTFSESSPQASKLNGTEFTLPQIDQSVETIITVKGTIQGNASETKSINAVMHYAFSNFNSDFVAQAEAQSEITAANVSLAFGGPNSASTNQDTTYILKYSNFLTGPIANFKVTITVPANFTVKKTTPTPAFGTVWQIGSLAANQNGSINITGSFSGQNIGDQELFTAQAEGSPSAGSGSIGGNGSGNSFILSASQYTVSITAIPLQTTVSLVSGTNQGSPTVVSPGANLEYKITYANNGSTVARGVNVTATLNGQSFDLNQIHAQGAVINGNQITWNGALNSSLALLQPNQNGSLLFSVSVKNPATKSNQKNISLTTGVSITSADFQQPFLAPDLILQIATVPIMDAAPALSAGANPPKVGQPSTYIITISLRNASNDISQSVVTFNLPNAAFNGIVQGNPEQPNVTYDNATKKITWNVGNLTANAGTFSPLRKLQFSITINPGPTDANAAMALVNNLKFSGTDSFTNQQISATHSSLTTVDDQANPYTITP